MPHFASDEFAPSPRPAESDLPHGERQFRQLLEKLPAAAYICDAQGLITYFNEAAARVWGCRPRLNDPANRFCGSFKLFAADGSPIAHESCWVAQALRLNKEFYGDEVVIEHPDGRRVTVLPHVSPIRDAAGRVTGAVNVMVDISDRKQGEEAQARLAAIVESSEDAIISKTLDGTILSWNTGASRLFGYTAAEAIGAHISLIIPEERRNEHDEILAKLRRGERIEHFETIRIDKHGRRLDISLTVSPVRNAQGRIVGASKVARDITARKQADAALVRLKDELALQLSDLKRLHEMSMRLAPTLELGPVLEETLRTVAAIEGAELGFLSLWDGEQHALCYGASLGFDQEFVTAVQRSAPDQSLHGQCFLERRHVIIEDVETDPAFAPHLATARQAGFRAVHSVPLVTRSGAVVGVLSIHFREPHRPSERELRLVDICVRQAVDFIENARLYTELRNADRRKDEFLATLAHELRNPLAPVSNALHILRLSDDLPPSVEHVRDIMERQINHMVRLVDDLMEVSRITRGKIQLRKERVDLVAVTDTAVETSRPLIDAAGHRLAITVPQGPLLVNADAVRLAQVIANLLNNAAKYTNPEGQIWLAVRREGDEAVISVKDSGVGIPPDLLSRVFEMFTQIDRSLNRAQGGLGIGLTLAKRLVQLHGGCITVHSEGLDRGTEFVVRLPLAAAPVEPAAPPADSRAGLGSHRILVVDDTRAAAYVLSKLLEALGQQVHTVHDATSALDVLRADRFDVVISDIGMPNMNGYELARQVRQELGENRLALVALTGYGQESDKLRAYEAGFDHHLVKPVSVEDLRELLQSLPVSGGENPNAEAPARRTSHWR